MTAAPITDGWDPATAAPAAGVRANVGRTARRIGKVLGLRPAGWAVFGLAFVLLTAGAVLRWVEFTLAGMFCLVLGVIALLFTLGRPAYAVRLSLTKPHVVVGQEAGGMVEIISRSRRGSLPSRMDVPVAAERVAFAVPWLRTGKGHREEFAIPTDRRAVVPVGPAQSIQGDPFGLSGRGAVWTDELELYVHPRTVSLPGRQSGFVHDLEGHPTSKLTNSDMSFHALREYVPGDDRRHVHWKSSARAGRLMVRQFDETRQSRVCVAVDIAQGSYRSPDEFEVAISAAASVVLQAFREDNPLALVTTRELIPVISPMRTLDEMCRIEPVAGVAAFDLAQVVFDHEPAASIVIWVTGGGVTPQDVRRIGAKFDADVRVIAIRVDERIELSVRTVANSTLIQVGSLDDLPRAMRRAMQ